MKIRSFPFLLVFFVFLGTGFVMAEESTEPSSDVEESVVPAEDDEESPETEENEGSEVTEEEEEFVLTDELREKTCLGQDPCNVVIEDITCVFVESDGSIQTCTNSRGQSCSAIDRCTIKNVWGIERSSLWWQTTDRCRNKQGFTYLDGEDEEIQFLCMTAPKYTVETKKVTSPFSPWARQQQTAQYLQDMYARQRAVRRKQAERVMESNFSVRENEVTKLGSSAQKEGAEEDLTEKERRRRRLAQKMYRRLYGTSQTISLIQERQRQDRLELREERLIKREKELPPLEESYIEQAQRMREEQELDRKKREKERRNLFRWEWEKYFPTE